MLREGAHESDLETYLILALFYIIGYHLRLFERRVHTPGKKNGRPSSPWDFAYSLLRKHADSNYIFQMGYSSCLTSINCILEERQKQYTRRLPYN